MENIIDYDAELEVNTFVDWAKVYRRAREVKREKARQKKRESDKKKFIKNYPWMRCLADVCVD